jgi:hypothetical protein
MDSGQFGSGGAFAVDLGRRGHSNLLLPPKGTSRPAQTSVEFGLRICSVLPVSDDVPFEDKKTIHAKTAKSRLESINKAASGYANLLGGFPESLGALGSPPWGQQANCRAAGPLERRLDNSSAGYLIEYHSGPPSTAFTESCGGAKSYTITARPIVYGKTGLLNLYTDESGDIRCTDEDRPANASDGWSCNLVRFSPSGPPSSDR